MDEERTNKFLGTMDKERASKFLSAIERYSKEQMKAFEAKDHDIEKKELQMAEATALREAYLLIQGKMVLAHKLIESSISKNELKNRKTLITKREKIKDKTFSKSEALLIEFTKNDDKYLSFLGKSLKVISDLLSSPGTVIYVKPDDVKFSEQIKRFYGRSVEIKVDESIKIGGVIAENRRMALIINGTLDGDLEEQKVWFMQNSGLKIL